MNPSIKPNGRSLLVGLLSLLVIFGVWFGLTELNPQARVTFIVFGLAIIGWTLTKISGTYIALAAVVVLATTGISEASGLFEALGDPIIWLLLSAFVIAGAVAKSGLAERLTMSIAARARSVNHLFYLLTAVLILTAFIIPSTSGRAALTLPVFLALRKALNHARISRALALLFPSVILLSAVASLIGAGAHLVTVDILWRMGGELINFGRWLLLGLPFALVSSFAATWIILHMFLTRAERRQTLRLNLTADGAGARKLRGQEKLVLVVIIALVGLWSTEALHGFNNTLVALIGAMIVTAPQWGVLNFKDAVKHVNWNLLLFMAATLEFSQALISSGGAQWLIEQFFARFEDLFAGSPVALVAAVAGIGLLAHLVITSRTARASVLIPIVVLIAVAEGYDPTTLAFVTAVAIGFSLTLQVSAKPVSMFSELEGHTYQPRDLMRLSSVLLPLHFGLLLIFALWVWPALGLTMERQTMTEPPAAPVWQESFPQGQPAYLPGFDASGSQTPDTAPASTFAPNPVPMTAPAAQSENDDSEAETEPTPAPTARPTDAPAAVPPHEGEDDDNEASELERADSLPAEGSAPPPPLPPSEPDNDGAEWLRPDDDDDDDNDDDNDDEGSDD